MRVKTDIGIQGCLNRMRWHGVIAAGFTFPLFPPPVLASAEGQRPAAGAPQPAAGEGPPAGLGVRPRGVRQPAGRAGGRREEQRAAARSAAAEQEQAAGTHMLPLISTHSPHTESKCPWPCWRSFLMPGSHCWFQTHANVMPMVLLVVEWGGDKKKRNKVTNKSTSWRRHVPLFSLLLPGLTSRQHAVCHKWDKSQKSCITIIA